MKLSLFLRDLRVKNLYTLSINSVALVEKMLPDYLIFDLGCPAGTQEKDISAQMIMIHTDKTESC